MDAAWEQAAAAEGAGEPDLATGPDPMVDAAQRLALQQVCMRDWSSLGILRALKRIPPAGVAFGQPGMLTYVAKLSYHEESVLFGSCSTARKRKKKGLQQSISLSDSEARVH